MDANLIEVPCPVCDHPAYRVLRENTLGNSLPELGYQFTPDHRKTYRLVKCNHCGHVYCSPLPKRIFEHYIDVEDAEYLRNEAQRLATAEKVLGTLRQYKKTGRLLDVGCSTGDFLRVAQQYYEVEGLELSNWAAGIAKQRGLKIHQSRLSEFKPVEPYDVVTLWGVIEHMECPKDEIRTLSRFVKKDGILCIWTGNVDSLTARVMGNAWWYYMGQHIQYFSEATLHRLLTDCGFRKTRLQNYPYVLNMSSVANSIGRYPLASRLFGRILKSRALSSATITFALPGEMFAVYSKA